MDVTEALDLSDDYAVEAVSFERSVVVQFEL